MPATKRAPRMAPMGSDSIPKDSNLETWKNVSDSTVVIQRVAEYGRLIDELIPGGRTFHLASQERRNMQGIVASSDYDIFTNGTLLPVDLNEDEPDTEWLKANPNHLDDADIPKLLRLPNDQFKTRLDEINHLPTITRLIERAREPELNMTVAQYEVLKLRAKAIRARTEGFIEPEGPDTGEDIPRPVTPR